MKKQNFIRVVDNKSLFFNNKKISHINNRYVYTNKIKFMDDFNDLDFFLLEFNKYRSIEYKKYEWYDEPDYLCFTHIPTNTLCTVERMKHTGHLNGYIYLFKDDFRELYNKTDDVDKIKNDSYFLHGTSDFDPSVHGGITFNEFDEYAELHKIGFDTRHAYDLSPLDMINPNGYNPSEATYKGILYVLDETLSLAQDAHDFINGVSKK